jgi:hypothetical protein
MAVDGGWWCCCSKSCTITQDLFDRPANTDIGGVLDECPDDDAGDWRVQASSHPEYYGDGSLVELTGEGQVLTNMRDPADSHRVQIQTIDEQPGNVYQILLRVAETTPESCAAGAHLLVEFYCGDGTANDKHSLTAYTVAAGGAQTLLGFVEFVCNTVNSQGGRIFYANYIAEDSLFCAGISNCLWVPRPFVLVRGVGDPVGEGNPARAGVGNASGPGLTIEIDDFIWSRLYIPNAVELPENACWACICKCELHDGYDNLIDAALFPPTMHLRIQGQCCTPFFTPCDLTNCPGAIDATIEIVWTQDYPSVGMDSWVGVLAACGGLFQYQFSCGAVNYGFASRFSSDGGATWSSYWDQATPPPSGPMLFDEGYTCTPILFVWTQALLSLNGFPCCLGCTMGDYTYTMTE